MIEVAKNELEDAVQIFDLLVLMHKEAGALAGTLDAEKVLQRIALLLNEGIMLVAREDGQIIGVLGLLKDSPWWGRDEYLADVFFFVHPEHRKNGTAVALLNAAKERAKILKLPIHMGVFARDRLDVKEAFLARKGFEKIGVILRG